MIKIHAFPKINVYIKLTLPQITVPKTIESASSHYENKSQNLVSFCFTSIGCLTIDMNYGGSTFATWLKNKQLYRHKIGSCASFLLFFSWISTQCNMCKRMTTGLE